MPSADATDHAVTGAFGFLGRYIARRLLAAGKSVRTLTNAGGRDDEFGTRVPAYPFHTHRPAALTAALRGVSVLYNTYWVRFNHRRFTHAAAVKKTMVLLQAAKAAGVQRLVHVSVTNPSLACELEYFSGKAQIETAVQESGISYAILRPAILFGQEGILINNIAWMLRRLPVIGVFGDGQYRLRPIYVDDLAGLAVQYGAGRRNTVVDAVGPETFTYRGLLARIGQLIGKPRPIVSVPPWMAHLTAMLIGQVVGDVVVTRAEIQGLMQERLYVESPTTGTTKLTDWVKEHAGVLGMRYASELALRGVGR